MADLRRYINFYHLAEEEGYDFFYDGVFFNVPPASPLRVAWTTAPAPVITYCWLHLSSSERWDLELFEGVNAGEGTLDTFTSYHRIKKPTAQAQVHVNPPMFDYGTKLMARTFTGQAPELVLTQPMIMAQGTTYMISCVPVDTTNILNMHIALIEYPTH